ncbi:MAG: carboxylating nicotinate-nucleotide diphosphorylase [Nitrospirae bacterium]|nr:carboxylating nicotinate-nucleotide diphosphorylase [Nitrospirota bacterium]
MPAVNNQTDSILLNALREDIGSGDVTTSAIIPEDHRSQAVLIAKEAFLLAGLPYAEAVFRLVNPALKFKANKKDGDKINKGDVIAKIVGRTRDLLAAERTALNLLQRLSGIATLTRRFVNSTRGLKVKITDTRKTTAGLRVFEKYAVRTGGGYNHRAGLFDGVLIKDNHVEAADGIKKAVKLCRENVPHMLKVEVETGNIREVRSALSAGADIIMLDNMTLQDMKKAVAIIRSKNLRTHIEASGGINLQNIRAIAGTGVDLISVGALTHSAMAVDISMEIKPLRRFIDKNSA